MENFDVACKKLMNRIKNVIPEGSTRARIRATTRVSRKLEESSIGETLGDEGRGMVVVVIVSVGGSVCFERVIDVLRSVVVFK